MAYTFCGDGGLFRVSRCRVFFYKMPRCFTGTRSCGRDLLMAGLLSELAYPVCLWENKVGGGVSGKMRAGYFGVNCG